jgi:hypothetical protein
MVPTNHPNDPNHLNELNHSNHLSGPNKLNPLLKSSIVGWALPTKYHYLGCYRWALPTLHLNKPCSFMNFEPSRKRRIFNFELSAHITIQTI